MLYNHVRYLGDSLHRPPRTFDFDIICVKQTQFDDVGIEKEIFIITYICSLERSLRHTCVTLTIYE